MPEHLTSGLTTLAAIPIWDQYVLALEHFLDFLAKMLHSAGLAVVVFTILIKTLLLPLTITSIKSSKAMQELQPKIKEIQKKYGKDRQRVSQETMRLYSQYKINPMAGCLPMLIQIPIFFGVYRAILHLSNQSAGDGFSDYWAGSFLWLENLASADPYHILPILAGVFQFVQTKMMRPSGQGKPSDPQQAMMNTMMNFMPLMVVFFGWSFASGPVVYWVTQSVYSVVQQWFITGWGSMKDWVPGLPELPEHKRLGYRPPRPLDEVVVVTGDGAPVKRPGIMGWFDAKMQEAQAQANARATSGPTASDTVVVKGQKPVKKGSPAAKSQAKSKSGAQSADIVAPEADIIDVPSTPVVPRKSKGGAAPAAATAETAEQNGSAPKTDTSKYGQKGSNANVKRPKLKSDRTEQTDDSSE